MITVSPEVRELYIRQSHMAPKYAAQIRAGQWDKTTGMQEFARFEAETLERAAAVADQAVAMSDEDTPGGYAVAHVARNVADKIRILKGRER